MRQLAAVLAALAACTGDARVASVREEIVGGSDAPGDDAVVAIVRRSVSCVPETLPVSCTGTLVAPRVVVTAAHCLEGGPPNAFEVFVGASYPDGVRIAVAGGRADPTIDIAALILAEPAPAAITPVAMQMDALPDLTGQQVRLVGYGITSATASDVGTRRAGTARISEQGSDQLTMTPDPAMSCRGDSGGPVLAMLAGAETLVGVTSFGDAACMQLGVAVRVDRQAELLAGVIAEAAGSAERRPFDPDEPFCATSCTSDADCLAETVCFAAHCSYHGLPAGELGASCTTDGDCQCVALPGSGCREFRPCVSEGAACKVASGDDGCGCRSTGGGGAAALAAAALAVALRAVVGRRRRSLRTARR